jgi:hypothetical protein
MANLVGYIERHWVSSLRKQRTPIRFDLKALHSSTHHTHVRDYFEAWYHDESFEAECSQFVLIIVFGRSVSASSCTSGAHRLCG